MKFTKKTGIKHSDIKKALVHLALGTEIVVVKKHRYALEAKQLNDDYIVLIVYREKELGSQQYFYDREYKVAKDLLLEVLYV